MLRLGRSGGVAAAAVLMVGLIPGVASPVPPDPESVRVSAEPQLLVPGTPVPPRVRVHVGRVVASWRSSSLAARHRVKVTGRAPHRKPFRKALVTQDTRVRVPAPVTKRSRVRVCVTSLGVDGKASPRSCSRARSGFGGSDPVPACVNGVNHQGGSGRCLLPAGSAAIPLALAVTGAAGGSGGGPGTNAGGHGCTLQIKPTAQPGTVVTWFIGGQGGNGGFNKALAWGGAGGGGGGSTNVSWTAPDGSAQFAIAGAGGGGGGGGVGPHRGNGTAGGDACGPAGGTAPDNHRVTKEDPVGWGAGGGGGGNANSDHPGSGGSGGEPTACCSGSLTGSPGSSGAGPLPQGGSGGGGGPGLGHWAQRGDAGTGQGSGTGATGVGWSGEGCGSGGGGGGFGGGGSGSFYSSQPYESDQVDISAGGGAGGSYVSPSVPVISAAPYIGTPAHPSGPGWLGIIVNG